MMRPAKLPPLLFIVVWIISGVLGVIVAIVSFAAWSSPSPSAQRPSVASPWVKLDGGLERMEVDAHTTCIKKVQRDDAVTCFYHP